MTEPDKSYLYKLPPLPNEKKVNEAVQKFENKEEPPTLVNRPHTRRLIAKEVNYINFCEKMFFRGHGFPTPETAAQYLGYSLQEINYFLSNKNVRRAFDRRGLPWQSAGISSDITPTQVAVASILSNFADSRTEDEKLASLGVTPTQYYAWLQQPSFQEFVAKLADSNLQNIRPTAIAQYSSLIRKGEFPAIKHYLDVTGEFGSNQNVNFEAALQIVVETIQKHVKDPTVLQAISGDLMKAIPTLAQPNPSPSSVIDSTASLSPNGFGRKALK